MTNEQKVIAALFAIWLVTAAACLWSGLMLGKHSVKLPEPVIVEKVDTVTITEVRIDTVYRVREKVSWLERVDTVTNTVIDTVAVVVPLSKYVAQQDSLYRVEATGYDVTFDQITVYPKTITEEHWVETVKASTWGIGIQAGYGATLHDNTVRLAPYVGVGISWNILTW
jgi:hypothetical protein